MKKKAIKFFAEYFRTSEKDARENNTMTIDCMAKFAEQQVKAEIKKIERRNQNDKERSKN